jgi:adenylate cyclase
MARGKAFADRDVDDRSDRSQDRSGVTATRRLAAILAGDVAGYSRLMGADEEGTLDRLKAHRRQLVDPKIKEHRGRIVKTTGDGMLVEFSSVVDAVRCAVEIQRAMVDRNAETDDDKRITFRIGVNVGDVIIDGGDIFGDGVNIAARLEALAEPGGVCISRTVRDQIRDKLPYAFDDLGEQSVKNIARPVRTYALDMAKIAALPPVAVSALLESPPRRRRPRPAAPFLSMIVLPFANLSSDPDQEYFADAISDDLTTDLSRIPGSFVIARNTAFTYKGKPVDAKQLGRQLNIRYVIEGSVRRAGDQILVNIQLIDAETGAHLWADRFESDCRNLLEAQNEITGRLAKTLNVEVTRAAGKRLERESASDPDARDLVMRAGGLVAGGFSAANAQAALSLYEQALAQDPQSIDAKIGVARILSRNLTNGWSTSIEQDMARCEELLLEALEHDPNDAQLHRYMGNLRRTQNRLVEARIEYETALTLDRNDTFSIRGIAHVLVQLGQPEFAIPYFEKSIRLSPHDPNVVANYIGLGRCHLYLGDTGKAVDFFMKARAVNPKLCNSHFNLAAALALKGNLSEARASLAEAIRLKPDANSVAKYLSNVVTNSMLDSAPYRALVEKTLIGLRRAGLPDE